MWCAFHGQDSRAKVRVHLEKILNTSKISSGLQSDYPIGYFFLHLGIGSCYSYSIRKRLKELLVEFLLPPTSSLSSLSPIDHLRQVTALHYWGDYWIIDLFTLLQFILYYQRSLDAHVVCVEGVSVSQSKLHPGYMDPLQ